MTSDTTTNDDADGDIVAETCPRHLYRAVEKPKTGPRDYRTRAATGRLPPEDATAEEVESWGALSTWDSEAMALEVGRRSRSNDWVVRFDIPEGSTIRCKSSRSLPGHYDVYFDDWTQLRDCLSPDYAAIRVERSK